MLAESLLRRPSRRLLPTGDTGLSDFKAEFEQLAMDRGGAPQWIVNAHPPDQRAQVRVDLRSASKGARFPTPVMAKAGPMPTYRSDDSDGPEHRWKPPIQQDQEQAIPICELDATPHPPLQHNQLMTSAAFSASSRLFDLNGETDRVTKRQKSGRT